MKVIANNKRASFDYHISEKYEAGMCLVGSEVKSIRNGGISINESFIFFADDGLYLKNAYIKPYDKCKMFCPESKRDRKLLLHKKELAQISKAKQLKGLTVVPLKVYINDKGLVKIQIALAKGKKLYDKRNALKEHSANREIQRELKSSRG